MVSIGCNVTMFTIAMEICARMSHLYCSMHSSASAGNSVRTSDSSGRRRHRTCLHGRKILCKCSFLRGLCSHGGGRGRRWGRRGQLLSRGRGSREPRQRRTVHRRGGGGVGRTLRINKSCDILTKPPSTVIIYLFLSVCDSSTKGRRRDMRIPEKHDPNLSGLEYILSVPKLCDLKLPNISVKHL